MTTIVALLVFAALLAAVSQVQRVLFLRGARAHGWNVMPWRMTRVSVGPFIEKSIDDVNVRVSLPAVDGENQGNWTSRWIVEIEGSLPAVPGAGLAFSRQRARKRLLVPKALRARDDVPALPRVHVKAAQDSDVTTLLRDGDVLASLQSCFADASPIEELLLTSTHLRTRARMNRWAYDELDAVVARAVELAESCAEPS